MNAWKLLVTQVTSTKHCWPMSSTLLWPAVRETVVKSSQQSSQKSTIFSLAQTSTPIIRTTFLLIGGSLGFVGKHPLHWTQNIPGMFGTPLSLRPWKTYRSQSAHWNNFIFHKFSIQLALSSVQNPSRCFPTPQVLLLPISFSSEQLRYWCPELDLFRLDMES